MFGHKSVQIILGVLTILPFLLILVVFIYMLYETASIILSNHEINPFLYLTYLGYLFPLFMTYSGYYLVLGLIYLVHILQNYSLDKEKNTMDCGNNCN